VVGAEAQKFLRELLGIDEETMMIRELGKVMNEEVKEVKKKNFQTELEGDD
jgi:hypothetical protein